MNEFEVSLIKFCAVMVVIAICVGIPPAPAMLLVVVPCIALLCFFITRQVALLASIRQQWAAATKEYWWVLELHEAPAGKSLGRFFTGYVGGGNQASPDAWKAHRYATQKQAMDVSVELRGAPGVWVAVERCFAVAPAERGQVEARG